MAAKLTLHDTKCVRKGSHGLCSRALRVPSKTTWLIQQVHMAAGHTVCAIAEEALVQRG